MEYETIAFEIADGIATITLNRPEAANALNLTMARELADVGVLCDEDPAIRAVVATGSGSFFCGGGDLAAFAGAGDRMGVLITEMTTYFHAAISRFSRMDAPTVAAVNGPAAGAGLGLAMSCDLVVAAESATFVSAYTAAGLTPDGSSTYFLPRLVGSGRALELMLLNRRIDAAEARDWGIVNRVVPDGTELNAANEIATRLAHGPTKAYGGVKRLLLDSLVTPLETQMENEALSIAEMTHTADAREGIDAFLSKRKPTFQGK